MILTFFLLFVRSTTLDNDINQQPESAQIFFSWVMDHVSICKNAYKLHLCRFFLLVLARLLFWFWFSFCFAPSCPSSFSILLNSKNQLWFSFGNSMSLLSFFRSLSLNGNALISALCWNVSNSVRTSTAIVHAHTQCTHFIFYLAQFLPLESILSVRYACTSNAHCTAHSVQGMCYKFKSTPKRERNSTLETVVSTLLKEKMIMTLWFFV